MAYQFRHLVSGALFSWVVFASPARAAIFTLDHWNTIELQTSLDTVTVVVGGDTSNGFTCQSNQICVRWNDGAGTATPTVKAIITLAYDDGNGGTSAPATTAEAGGSTAWVFNGSGNADGFGRFDRNNDKGPGNETTAGTVNWLVFTLASIPSGVSNWDFAAHVQYNDGCSGWISSREHPRPGSNPNCDPPSVPEPSTMALFGAGLIGLALWSGRLG